MKRTKLSPKLIKANHSTGFTIVELLVVVVVIAILAAVTIVAYNGISHKARDAALRSDLVAAGKQLGLYYVESNTYPSTNPSLKTSGSNTLTYLGGGGAYCVEARNASVTNTVLHITEAGSVLEGACPPPTMQAFTSAQCATLTTFTGVNSSAVITLADNRGGIVRMYEVAKLADGRCWMLNNLKLGSLSGPIVLTAVDSNVASAGFTLPRVELVTSGVYDSPVAYGPVDGDTGSGATNYGYLYNWSAATAGETRVSAPAGSGDASYSICPRGWRLPIGDSSGEFSWLNAKMNNPAATAPSSAYTSGFYENWRNTGPFKGVYSGRIYTLPQSGQGVEGLFWSRTAYIYDATVSHINIISSSHVNPYTYGARSLGLAVRCLLN